MKLETKCEIAEMTGEILIGSAAGIIMTETIFPKCNKMQKVVVTLGSSIVIGMIGRTFGEKFYEYCDEYFGTEFTKNR